MSSSPPDHGQVLSPDTDPVRYAVLVATRRLRQRRAIRYGATGFLAGSAVGFLFALAISCNALRETTLPGGAAFLILPSLSGLLAGTLFGVAGKYDPVSVARLLERRLDLKDRVSTSLTTSGDASPLVQAQNLDTRRHAPTVGDVCGAIPLSPLPRRVYIAAAAALAVGLTYLAPELPVFWSSTKRSEQVAVKKEGERLLAVAKAAAQEAKKLNIPEAEKAARKVEKLGKEMTRGRMPLREALMERAKLGEELRKAEEKILREKTDRAAKQTRANLSGTAKDVANTLKNKGTAPLSNSPANSPDSRMKSLQDALAQGDKQAVARALRAMADAADNGEPTPGAERDRMGKQLDSLKDGLNKNNLSDAGTAVGNAGEAIKQGELPDAARSLREAADKIESAGATPSPPEGSGQQQSQTGTDAAGGTPQQGQSAMQKLANDVQKMAGGAQQDQNGSSKPSATSSGQQSSGSPTSAQGGQPSASQNPSSGASQGGKQNSSSAQGSQSQSGQPNTGNQPGQSSSQAGKTGGSASSGGKSGAGGKSGSGAKGGISNKSGGGGKGSGEGSSGSVKSGGSTQRLSNGAKEQNIRGRQSGPGPETVITESDSERTSLPAASLPYYKEFVKGRKGQAGESAQTRESVPSAYRNQVRGYFDSLPPAAKAGAKGQ